MSQPSSTKRSACVTWPDEPLSYKGMLSSSSKIVKFTDGNATVETHRSNSFVDELLGDGSCWHGTWKSPSPSAKIAAFDIDQTLITYRKDPSRPSKRFSSNETDWVWLNSQILPKLRQAHLEGYTIVLFSNQAGLVKSQHSFRLKVPLMARHGLQAVPFHVFAALDYSIYRKPATGMWDYFKQYCNNNIEVDLKTSFYVGDAAGRLGGCQRPFADFSDSDRKFAHNLGVRFFTPEEYFLSHPVSTSWSFRLRNWPSLQHSYTGPLFTPSSSALVRPRSGRPEVILFVGPPGAGKTKFYRDYFKHEGYVRIGDDTSLTDSLALLSFHLQSTETPQSCVIDSLVPDRVSRARVLQLVSQINGCSSPPNSDELTAAESEGRLSDSVTVQRRSRIKIRLFHFTTDPEICKHNTAYRALYPLSLGAAISQGRKSMTELNADEGRGLVTDEVWASWNRRWQNPDAVEEGVEVVKIHFRFNGTEQEEIKWRHCLDVWKRPQPAFGRRKTC